MEGGWLNSTIVNHFRDYADLCFRSFGDRVSMGDNLLVYNYVLLGVCSKRLVARDSVGEEQKKDDDKEQRNLSRKLSKWQARYNRVSDKDTTEQVRLQPLFDYRP